MLLSFFGGTALALFGVVGSYFGDYRLRFVRESRAL